jgi:hypothetical protein
MGIPDFLESSRFRRRSRASSAAGAIRSALADLPVYLQAVLSFIG